MKKIISNPMTILFMLFAIVLIGSNTGCTGKASNHEKQSITTTVDETTSSTTVSNSGEVQALSSTSFDAGIKSGIVLVDFWATWCKPCKMQSPVIEEISSDMVGKASVYKLDIDQNPSIADRYNVQSIPTMIIFKDGKVIGQFVGLTEKGVIVSAIEKQLAGK